jgi:ferrochelatase
MGAPRDLDEVELFLKNMFNDKNIITVKSDLLRSLISFAITKSRQKEAKSNYAKLGGISPLVEETKLLEKALKREFEDDEILSIMRYTPPFAKDVITKLNSKGIDEVVLLPLYPHYSTTTVKSSLEDFDEWAKRLDFTPKVRVIPPYYKDKSYNEAIIKTIEERLSISLKEIDLIFSAHSLPQKIVDRGDSYQKEVEDHQKILSKLLQKRGYEFRSTHLAYQSKLGPVKWLEPTLESVLKSLESKKALIVPISFTLDNSETIFELGMEYKELADELGFEFYEVASCPNSSRRLVETFKGLIDG